VYLTLPILIPLLSGILVMALWRRRKYQRIVAVIGSAALLVAALALFVQVYNNSGILVVQIGNWPAPYGITLVADLMSAMLVLVTGVMALVISIYALYTMDRSRERFGFLSLYQFLLMGVCGSFLTGDIFNLYVWFEVMLMASFVLLALGGERHQLEGALKYVTLNLIASAFFLAGVGILYGAFGTLNMADLAVKMQSIEDPRLLTTLSMVFLIAFGIKAAIFPLFFWLPASYHTPPIATTAIFAALLSKVGVYALIRVFTLLFIQEVPFTHSLILVLAGFTMLTGVLGAASHYEIRRILSFHIVSQIGYMIMGLGLYTRVALAGALYYIVHNMLAKTNLFLISGLIYRLRGTYQLKKLGGLYVAAPGLAFLFLIAGMSLAGLPPSSGFFGKLTLVWAGLETRHYVIVAVALVTSILTLYSMTKIWAEAFWKSSPDEALLIAQNAPLQRHETWTLYGPIVALTICILGMALGAGPILGTVFRAADQLLEPSSYIEAVLGVQP
jgi:multicomponent Na+:H+ antiporter subunit D